MTSIVNITSAAQLAPFYVDKKLVVISFWAEWCDSCKPMRSVLEQLARQFPDVHILEVTSLFTSPVFCYCIVSTYCSPSLFTLSVRWKRKK